MALARNRFAAGLVALSCLSLVSTPILAAGLPRVAAGHSAAPAEQVAQHGRRYYRDRDRVDGGDILAGVLILGGIAAIASAASKADQRDRDYREEPRPYPEDPRYREREDRGSGTPYGSSGMDRAVDMCVAEVERRATVGGVDSASRTGSGWFVSGETGAGAPWSCRIGNDGRISDVEVGDNFRADAASVGGEAQYDEETYARARARVGMPLYTPRVTASAAADADLIAAR